ncbi:MAG: hypothetical protein ACH350_05690 [Parachlamydiaceae bacterium]
MTIQIRLFMGFLFNKELKIHLNQNSKWREAKLIGECSLIEAISQDKEYLGCFIPSLIPYDELKKQERDVRDQLQIYCPKLNLDKRSIYLFSQLFIS